MDDKLEQMDDILRPPDSSSSREKPNSCDDAGWIWCTQYPNCKGCPFEYDPYDMDDE